MIEVKYRPPLVPPGTQGTPEEHETYLHITGHAGAKTGNEFDLVCSAVSTLAYTWLFHVIHEDAAGHVEDYYQHVDNGEMLIRVTPLEPMHRSFTDAFQVILDGFEMLETSYPAFIRITKLPYILGRPDTQGMQG